MFVDLLASFDNTNTDPNFTPSSLVESYAIADGRLRVYNADFDLQLTEVTPPLIPPSGVFTSFPNADTGIYVEFLNGLYTAHVFHNNNGNMSADSFQGTYAYDNTRDVVSIFYAAVVSGLGSPVDRNAGETFQYTANLGPGSSFSMTGIDDGGTLTYTLSPASPYDGTWLGFHDGCSLTIQFNRGLFRSFLSNCQSGATDESAFLGTYVQRDSTTLNVTIVASKDGAIFTEIGYYVAQFVDGSLLRLVNADQDLTLTYYSTAPSGVQVRIVLDGDVGSFDEAAFIRDVATLLAVPQSLVSILQVTSGSIIVDMLIADQPGGQSARDSFAALADDTSIGGYTVLSITDTTPAANSLSSSAGLRVDAWLSLVALLGALLAIL